MNTEIATRRKPTAESPYNRAESLLRIKRLHLAQASVEEISAAREVAVEAIKSGGAKAMIAELQEPASAVETTRLLAELFRQYPDTKDVDVALIGENLFRFVRELDAPRGAIRDACDDLLRTSVFRPRIPEVLEAVERWRGYYRAQVETLRRLPIRIAYADEELADRAEKRPFSGRE